MHRASLPEKHENIKDKVQFKKNKFKKKNKSKNYTKLIKCNRKILQAKPATTREVTTNHPFYTFPHQTTLASPIAGALWRFPLQMYKARDGIQARYR